MLVDRQKDINIKHRHKEPQVSQLNKYMKMMNTCIIKDSVDKDPLCYSIFPNHSINPIKTKINHLLCKIKEGVANKYSKCSTQPCQQILNKQFHVKMGRLLMRNLLTNIL